jgi:DNA-binding transcriptional LysR family regulator
MLDVRRLNVLREVVARGSFSGAADALHLSQSAVSQQVAALEREVGMQLLERTSDGSRRSPAWRAAACG